MRVSSPIHIREFINIVCQEKKMKYILDGWPVDTEIIMKYLVSHFSMLGIFDVRSPASSKIIYNSILFLLENSPELQELVKKGQKERMK
jgi:hypothetical protein